MTEISRLNYLLKLDVLTHYSNGAPKCSCCGEVCILFLTIDHIDNDGADHRRSLGNKTLYRWLRQNYYPVGFRVLCFNCNSGRDLNKGICPHNGLHPDFIDVIPRGQKPKKPPKLLSEKACYKTKRIRRRHEDGLCQCGQVPRIGFLTCEQCAKRLRDTVSKYRRNRKSKGIKETGVKIPTSIITDPNIASLDVHYSTKVRKQRQKDGLCECGNVPTRGLLMCDMCREYKNARARIRYHPKSNN